LKVTSCRFAVIGDCRLRGGRCLLVVRFPLTPALSRGERETVSRRILDFWFLIFDWFRSYRRSGLGGLRILNRRQRRELSGIFDFWFLIFDYFLFAVIGDRKLSGGRRVYRVRSAKCRVGNGGILKRRKRKRRGTDWRWDGQRRRRSAGQSDGHSGGRSAGRSGGQSGGRRLGV